VQKMNGNLARDAKSSRSSKRKTILLAVVAAVIILAIGAIVSLWLSKLTNLSIPTIGTIRMKGVEGYWDKNLTSKTEEYNWGVISPGASKNVTLYLRSISNFETTFNLTTGNWTFRDAASNIVAGPNSTTPYMNLTWNYNNTIVRPGETLQVTLRLQVDESFNFIDFLITNDVRGFGFDIYIRTSEHS
jgi:hypothetical protein